MDNDSGQPRDYLDQEVEIFFVTRKGENKSFMTSRRRAQEFAVEEKKMNGRSPGWEEGMGRTKKVEPMS